MSQEARPGFLTLPFLLLQFCYILSVRTFGKPKLLKDSPEASWHSLLGFAVLEITYEKNAAICLCPVNIRNNPYRVFRKDTGLTEKSVLVRTRIL